MERKRAASVSADYGSGPEMAEHRHSSTVSPLRRAMDDKIEIVQANELDNADRRLAELGYIQVGISSTSDYDPVAEANERVLKVFKREFSWLSCVSFAFSVSGLFSSVTTTYVYPLEAGGAASAVWCWLICGAGCMCIALSVAELCSAYPTSGGLYFTCKYLAPEAWMAEISWMCGWFNVLGQTVGLASTEYGCAQLLLAAISMSTNFQYVPTNRQTVGVMAAITVFHAVLNSFNTRVLERITRGYAIFHVGVLVSCCIALLVMCKDKHSSSYVWTEVTPDSGWTPTGFSFLFGFLSASWTMTDYDATAHIAEEIKNPEIKAPWAITAALSFTYIAGWLFTIVLSYCAGDIFSDNGILASPVEQPVAQIFYNVFGRAGGVVFTVFAFIILNFTGMTGMCAGGRTFWALSRDGLIPLSRVWYKINRRTQTPVYATWLVTCMAIAATLVGLGSYTAISAIFNATAVALDWSYIIPILCKMSTKRFRPGPYHLGKVGWWINAYATAWTVFVTVIFVLPTIRPVTAENMNYVSVILVGFAIFAVGYWYTGGRRFYIGPRVNVEVVSESGSQIDLMEGQRKL